MILLQTSAGEGLAQLGILADPFGDDVAGAFERFFDGGYALFSLTKVAANSASGMAAAC